MGSERHESRLGHLSFPDDSRHHHFPSLSVGLPATPKPFLPSLAGPRGRMTDVSFRKWGLFTPLPGRQLPLRLVERAGFHSAPPGPPALGLRPLQRWAFFLSFLPHPAARCLSPVLIYPCNGCPLPSHSPFSPVDSQRLSCDCPATSP